MAYEYRLRWQREGQPHSHSVLYQTHRGAVNKVQRLAWADEKARELRENPPVFDPESFESYYADKYKGMPSILWTRIDMRYVEEWS